MNQLNVNNFTFTYENKSTILKNVNLEFYSNQINLITGPSGGGKTTLLNSIAGLYPKFSDGDYQGEIQFNKQAINNLESNPVTVMFQNPDQQFAMKTAEEEITFALENIQTDPEKIAGIIDSVAQQCGIKKLMNRKLDSLSGGEKQKVALAIIIAMDRPVILLDEPFASIDNKSRKFLLNKLIQLKNEKHKMIIIVDHDLDNYQSIVDNVFRLNPKQKNILKLSKGQANQLFDDFKQNDQTQMNFQIPQSNDSNIFQFKNVQLKRNHDLLLKLMNFNLYSQKATLITGENGTGKSTLFKAITKLLKYQGTINYNQTDIQKISNHKYYQNLTLIFQEATKQFLKFTIQEEIELSMNQVVNNYYSNQTIDNWLKELGLIDHKDQNIYSLSEGQQKIIQIITMLIIGTPVLLLDEPFKGIDAKSIHFIVKLLNQAKKEQRRTVIIISHQTTGLAPLIDYHIQLANQTLTYQEAL